MLKAAKKNRVLRIPDEKAAEYKKLGYTITDMTGKVIYEPEDTAKKASALAAENENCRRDSMRPQSTQKTAIRRLPRWKRKMRN